MKKLEVGTKVKPKCSFHAMCTENTNFRRLPYFSNGSGHYFILKWGKTIILVDESKKLQIDLPLDMFELIFEY